MTSAKMRIESEDLETETSGSESPASGRSSVPPPIEFLHGRGRLVPALATGIEYPVEFGIKSPPAAPRHGRASIPTRWAKCRIRPAQKRIFPDGFYFLRTEEGRVHQLKVIGGVWHCLALAL
ncbi:MAG: hypothetical protein ACRD4R_10600 [Candidatus Acidiferrales bacterium]